MNTAEILRAAAARVREGWIQGYVGDNKGPNCAMGAINVAKHGNAMYQDHGFFVSDQLRQIVEAVTTAVGLAPCTDRVTEVGSGWDHVRAIVDWNNGKDQTAENVAVGLEYAALLWEQERRQTAAEPVQVNA